MADAQDLTAQVTDVNAWDTKDLVKKLEDAGLPVLESAAIKILGAVFDWVQDSGAKSNNKYIGLVLPYLPLVRAFALKQADKIAENELVPVSEDVKDAHAEVNKLASINGLPDLPMA